VEKEGARSQWRGLAGDKTREEARWKRAGAMEASGSHVTTDMSTPAMRREGRGHELVLRCFSGSLDARPPTGLLPPGELPLNPDGRHCPELPHPARQGRPDLPLHQGAKGLTPCRRGGAVEA
jgi:hypothetical protein